MNEIKCKLCMCGEGAVGKTSLIARFVHDKFGDKYLKTIGTNVTKKELTIDIPDRELHINYTFQIWDIMGQKEYRHFLKDSFFFGAKGVFMVFDLTRKETFEALGDWKSVVKGVAGDIPTIVLANKSDLEDQWQVDLKELADYCSSNNYKFRLTSAKTGEHVPDAFDELGKDMAHKYYI